MKNRILFAIGYCLISNFVGAQDLDTQLLNQFKQRIGYARPSRIESMAMSKGDVVVCGIPDITSYAALKNGWMLQSKNISIINPGDEVESSFFFKKDQESVSIDIYLSQENKAKVEKRFFDFFTGGSAPWIVGERGPIDIGDFSATRKTSNGDEIIFMRLNSCVRIYTRNSNFDVQELARWLQSKFKMQAWSETQKAIPRPLKDEVGKGNVREGQALVSSMTQPLLGHVGQPIEINVKTQAQNVAQGILLKEVFDHKQMQVRKVANGWVITPKVQGICNFRYVIIDSSTMLFSAYDISIEVQP
jgi:hypothetical protein